jgi:hypothetical protein
MATALIKEMRKMISEDTKGPLEPRLRASFCDWCKTKQSPEGLALLHGMAWPTQACPCHLVSYCSATCQASHWAAHSFHCEKLRGCCGEMPNLEDGPADLPAINLAKEVKWLQAEVDEIRRRDSLVSVMEVITLYTNLAKRNADLEAVRRRMLANLDELVLIDPNASLWHSEERCDGNSFDGDIPDEHWRDFVKEYQEQFREECTAVAERLFTEFNIQFA